MKSYYKSQGTFSAVFLFTLQPAIFGEDYYALVPFIMLTALIAGLICFGFNFFRLFHTENLTKEKKQRNKWICGIVICVFVILCTQFLPSPVQGFYWYNGSVYYTFFFGLSLILYSLLIQLIVKEDGQKKIMLRVGIIFLCIMIAFGNLITSLTTAIILVSGTVFLIILKNRNWKQLILPLIVYGICFYISLSAPGFSARQKKFNEGVGVYRPGVWGTVLLSFQCAVTQLYQWNTIPVLALYLFLVPVLWGFVSEFKNSFRMPWLVTLYSFCLQASMNAPTYYAFADPGPGRIENIRFYAMVIMIVINIFYWEGWIMRKLKVSKTKPAQGLGLSFLLGVILVFVGGLALSEKPHPITSVSAYQSYRSGDAGLYKHVQRQRLEILKDPEIKDALLRDFPKKPYVLFFDDITYDPEDWRNQNMSGYYHKDSVRLMTHEEFEASLENK